MPVTGIAWGVVGLGVVLLAASAVPLSRRMRPLRRALRRLSWRAEEVQRLTERAAAMQETLVELEQRAAVAEVAFAAGPDGDATVDSRRRRGAARANRGL